MGKNIVRNYQRELDAILRDLELSGERPKLFCHACCAPCSSYVMEYLHDYFDMTMFFYNPNIAPKTEFERRKATLDSLIEKLGYGIDVVTPPYDNTPFFAFAKGLEFLPEGGERCFLCYRERLERTAIEAKARGADYFCTTLSISPHKNARKINEIGEELAIKYGIKFLPSDFKKRGGYLRSIELSRIYGLYRQDYCGCIYSKLERDRLGRSSDTLLSASV